MQHSEPVYDGLIVRNAITGRTRKICRECLSREDTILGDGYKPDAPHGRQSCAVCHKTIGRDIR